jgi:acyl-CoA thioester hydrolase
LITGTDARSGGFIYQEAVLPQWLDANGHLNVAFYLLLFDRAGDALLESLGLGASYRAAYNRSVFVKEAHVRYLREVDAEAVVRIASCVAGVGRQRLALMQTLRLADAEPAMATCEVLAVHVDLSSRRPCPWPVTGLAALQAAYGSGGVESGEGARRFVDQSRL